MSIKKLHLVILFLIIFASACQGNAPSQPTMDQGQMETQVAQQVAALLTQTALSQPSATMTFPASAVPSFTATLEQPTELPSLEPTTQPAEATLTMEPASPTPLPTSSNTAPAPTATVKFIPSATPLQFVCQLVDQSPENGKTFKPNANFDAVWTVKNVGAATWNESEVDYRYKSGDKLHVSEIYDLSKNVKPGESIDLTVDMKAPDEKDEYKTTWNLIRGKNLLCTLTLEINVK